MKYDHLKIDNGKCLFCVPGFHKKCTRHTVVSAAEMLLQQLAESIWPHSDHSHFDLGKLSKLSRLVYVVEVILFYMLQIKRMSGQSL